MKSRELANRTMTLPGIVLAMETYLADAADTRSLLTDAQAQEEAQTLERLSRLVDYSQVAATGDLAERVRDGAFEASLGTKDIRTYLTQALRIGSTAANRRIGLAAQLLPSTNKAGDLVPPVQPVLATAFRAGDVSADTAKLIATHVNNAHTLATGGIIAPSIPAEIEESLTSFAQQCDRDFVMRTAQRTTHLIDPAGGEASWDEINDKEGIRFGKPRRGLVAFNGFLQTIDYESLMAAIGPATNPRKRGSDGRDNENEASSDTATGSNAADAVVVPRPHRAQQLLHGLLHAVEVSRKTSKLPQNGGLLPQLFVTVTLAELQEGLGSALLPFTGPIPVDLIRKTACDASIIPIVMGAAGEVLDVGHDERIVTPAIRKALIARDKGCTFPECTRVVQWTEAHHITHWANGGETSLANSCLLCSHHHHLIHRSNWAITTINNIAYFIPPPEIDPQRIPLRNQYHDPPTALAA